MPSRLLHTLMATRPRIQPGFSKLTRIRTLVTTLVHQYSKDTARPFHFNNVMTFISPYTLVYTSNAYILQKFRTNGFFLHFQFQNPRFKIGDQLGAPGYCAVSRPVVVSHGGTARSRFGTDGPWWCPTVGPHAHDSGLATRVGMCVWYGVTGRVDAHGETRRTKHRCHKATPQPCAATFHL